MNHILLHSSTLSLKTLIIKAKTPPTDRVIDFGKYKGKMLGTLPSTYLKWVSKNLRASDTLHWANLADEVLQHPLYQDRLEWERAQRLLTGDDAASQRVENPADELAHLSETFGWDNGDRAGWSRVDFQLLGTSKTGRIPRVGTGGRGREVAEGEKDGGSGGRRERRRERLRMKGKMGVVEKNEGSFGKAGEEDRTAENRQRSPSAAPPSPFPGRQALIKKVLERKRSL